MGSATSSYGNNNNYLIKVSMFFYVGFWEEKKTGVPGEKPLGADERTNNKLKTHMTPGPGIEPGTQWEANDLTTAPSLLTRSKL